MTDKRDVKLAKKAREKLFEKATVAFTGKIVSRDGSVNVPGVYNHVWVLATDETDPQAVYNRAVKNTRPNLDVIVGYAPGSKTLEILRTDVDHLAGYVDTGGLDMLAHGFTHRSPKAGGDDPVWVDRDLIIDGLYLTPGSGLAVNISPYEYDDVNGARTFYPGKNNHSIAASKPATGLALYVLVYLDTADNTIKTVAGATVVDLDWKIPTKPDTPNGGVTAGYVRLDGSQTSVSRTDIDQGRRLWLPTRRWFNDAEGDPAAVDGSPASDGTSEYAARRDHKHLADLELDDLSDVSAGAPLDGQFLKYTAELPGWLPVNLTLDELSDVVVPSPSTDDVLTYDGAQWVNSPPAGGGYPFTTRTVDAAEADADYSNLTDAETAASAGDLIEVGPGSYNEAVTVSVAVTIKGLDRDSCVLQQLLTISAAAIIENIKRSNTSSGFLVSSGAGPLLRNCNAAVSAAGTDNIGFAINDDAVLEDCVATVTGGSSTNNAIYATTASTSTVTIRGGEFTATTALLGNSGVTFNLYGPRLNGVINLNGATISAGSWWYDSIGLHNANDEAGQIVRNRGFFAATDDFNTDSFLAAWSWAGAPFVTPGNVSHTALKSIVFVGFTSGQGTSRGFLYRNDALTTAQIQARLAYQSLADSSYNGIRMDDGTDDNYVTVVIRKKSGADSYELVSIYRTGGGAVTTTVHKTWDALPAWHVIGIQPFGTKWSDWGFSVVMGVDAGVLDAFGVVGSGLTWTATRQGVVFYTNEATPQSYKGPVIDYWGTI